MMTLEEFRATRQGPFDSAAPELDAYFADYMGDAAPDVVKAQREQDFGYPGVKEIFLYQWAFNDKGSLTRVLVIHDNSGFVWYWGHPYDCTEDALDKAEEQLFVHFVECLTVTEKS